MALTDAGAPTMMLLDAFKMGNWKAASAEVVHTDPSLKVFDGRKPQTRKMYFQCLLSLEQRIIANPSIASAQPQSYYKLVLMDQRVDAGLGDAAYKAKLKELKGGAPGVLALPGPAPWAKAVDDDGFDAVLDAPEPPAAKVIGVKKKSAASATIAGLGYDFAAAPEPLPATVAGALADAAHHPTDASSSLDSSSSSSDGFDAVTSEAKEWIDLGLDGPRIKVDWYTPKDQPTYTRLIGRCMHHPGSGCERKRTTTATHEHGPHEPICFLYAWHEMGAHMSAAEHRQRGVPPTREAVARWADVLAPLCQPVLKAIHDASGGS